MLRMLERAAQSPTRPASPAATRRATAFFRPLLLVGPLLFLSACSLFRPAFQSPVEPLPATPSQARHLADLLTPLAPAPESLNIKLGVTVRGGGVRGRQNLTLHGLWAGPERLKFRASGSAFVGGLFQVVRNGSEVSVHMLRDGQFFRGPVAQLDARPDVLYGFQPGDIVRALLAVPEARQALEALPDNALAPPDPDSHEHWLVAEPLVDARREVYRIRRSDGLVDRITAFDPFGRLKLTVLYTSYAYFDGALYPNRFEMTFHESGLHMKAEVESVRANHPIRPEAFSLDAPRGLETQPLAQWLESIPYRPIYIEK